ncbi:MAG: DHH family phosphoesterase [Lachnospiraceae bacterium]|nr:DHH family phosphoesterase [Lachnospiraceae bacterium]
MKDTKLTGQLKNYLHWPLIYTCIWAALIVILFPLAGVKAGFVGLGFFAIQLIMSMFLLKKSEPQLLGAMITFANRYGKVQEKLLQDFKIPYALLDKKGNFLWMNEEFIRISGRERSYHRHISTIFENVQQTDLPLDEEQAEYSVTSESKTYRMIMQRVETADLLVTEEMPLSLTEEEDFFIAVTLFDETELVGMRKEREEDQMVVGYLTLDNYDEVLEGVEDVRKSLLVALVERKINKYFASVDAVVKKLNHDRYFFFMRKKSLDELEKNKFALLDEVKTVSIGNEMAMTISAGIGLGGDSFLSNSDAARVAMDLALGRGGDQVVVKDGYRTRFYGGKTESAEKITRVKARVKAQALKEILTGKNRVVIMGHKISDIDSIGAAIGLYRAAQSIGKPASIVADDVAESVRPVIDGFRDKKGADPEMFVDRRRAKELTNADTALIIVDTNRASYTACKELLHLTTSIVVFDHHRQGVDRIDNAVLSYIEPYASSACEMVAEVLQYFDESLRLKSNEADAMYAGIVVDTNGFITRTGVRTFEAAAYLRRSGADITRVRKMFRDEPEDLRARAKAIADAELFQNEYAISICPSEGTSQPTVVAAQAANELLNVKNVKASFVLTSYNDQIYISARAIDEVNVQLIMERLGGGGHLNIAGAQLQEYTIDEAVELLKNTIIEMHNDGDL